MKTRIMLTVLVALLAGCGPEYDPPTPVDVPIISGEEDADIPPYTSCDEAPGPVGYGEPGFNDRLDENGDGVICAGGDE